jgi:hypothetical protein
MYFPFADVERLVTDMRRRFPGATLIFDAVPRWLANASGKPSKRGYQPPPWLWGIDADKRQRLNAHRLRLPRGRGVFFGYLAPLIRRGGFEILRARL